MRILAVEGSVPLEGGRSGYDGKANTSGDLEPICVDTDGGGMLRHVVMVKGAEKGYKQRRTRTNE